MKNQLMADFAAMKQMLLEQKAESASSKQTQLELEKMLREQQAELTSLREALARKNANRSARPATPIGPASPAPTITAIPAKTPDTSRRKMLKRMGLAVLAGGAALGVTAATYAPAEARISVNPTAKIGAIITRNGASMTVPTVSNYGLLASADDSFDATAAAGPDVGVYGNSSIGYGVYGNSPNNTGVYGFSHSGTGVEGNSFSGTGVYARTGSASNPAIIAENQGTANGSGVALQIYVGGLSVAGAGIGSATCAFIHQTTAGNISGTATKIDNPLCNSRPDALLFVTPNVTPKVGVNGGNENKIVGVIYVVGSASWYIYHQDVSNMIAGLYFNVLIINP